MAMQLDQIAREVDAAVRAFGAVEQDDAHVGQPVSKRDRDRLESAAARRRPLEEAASFADFAKPEWKGKFGFNAGALNRRGVIAC